MIKFYVVVNQEIAMAKEKKNGVTRVQRARVRQKKKQGTRWSKKPLCFEENNPSKANNKE